jgi:hypothetical protein
MLISEAVELLSDLPFPTPEQRTHRPVPQESPIDNLPFPTPEQRTHRPVPQESPIDDLPFNNTFLTDVVAQLIDQDGPYVEVELVEPSAVSDHHINRPTIPNVTLMNDGSKDADLSLPSPAAIARLNSLYPTYAKFLDRLQRPEYKDAYRACFRVRLYDWVVQDLSNNSGITHVDVVSWVGFQAPKTFANLRSRVSVIKSLITWLRSKPKPLDDDMNGKLVILTMFVEGPLTLLRVSSTNFSDSEPDGSDGGADLTAQVIGMSGAKLTTLVTGLKHQRRLEET